MTLYKDIYSTAEMRDIWSERSTISQWLHVEKTLAQCQAKLEIIPISSSDKINQLSADQIDTYQLREDMNLVGRPILGLVRQMRVIVGEENAEFVHYKATTQDIMDTAMCLQMRSGLSLIQGMIQSVIAKLKELIDIHSHTRMMGRTNGQYAIPISFSSKMKVWVAELERRSRTIGEATNHGLAVQIGGPVGDLSSYGSKTGENVKSEVATALGLPTISPHWQNARDGIADIIHSLGALCATLCKISHNVNHLSSSDIGELSESYTVGKGASSSMSHKKNQRASEYGEAVSRLGRHRSEQINELTLHEHERSGGVWIAEWIVVPDVFMFTSGALMWSDRLFKNLVVNKEAMLSSIDDFENKFS